MSGIVIVDIIIIGAGLGGSLAASVLSRAGHKVALIDAHADYPEEFRAEKMGCAQIALFEKLGLADVALAATTPHDRILIARFGRVVGQGAEREFGFRYAQLVNGVRRALGPGVDRIVGRVVGIETRVDCQSVALSDGTVLRARLLIVSTGLSEAVRGLAGVERIVSSRAHSLSIGFSFAQPAKAFSYDSLIYYGDRADAAVSYITTFKMGDVMRANLFTYRSVAEPWTKQVRAEPAATLRASMPGLEAIAGELDIAGPIALRPSDLSGTAAHRKPGVVLIGDAFATCCPVIGMGVMKVLTDVERLCVGHIPRWFATPGMGAEKIAAFYDDAVKTACDAQAHAASVYARSLYVDPGYVWAARRFRNRAVRRAIYALKNVGTSQPRPTAAAGVGMAPDALART